MNKTKLESLSKPELVDKCQKLAKALDQRPEARFGRWVENGAFLAGVIVMLLSVFDFPWLDMSALELTLVVSVLVVPKVFGKAVGIDMLGKLMGNATSLAKTVANRKKNG